MECVDRLGDVVKEVVKEVLDGMLEKLVGPSSVVYELYSVRDIFRVFDFELTVVGLTLLPGVEFIGVSTFDLAVVWAELLLV